HKYGTIAIPYQSATRVYGLEIVVQFLPEDVHINIFNDYPVTEGTVQQLFGHSEISMESTYIAVIALGHGMLSQVGLCRVGEHQRFVVDIYGLYKMHDTKLRSDAENLAIYTAFKHHFGWSLKPDIFYSLIINLFKRYTEHAPQCLHLGMYMPRLAAGCYYGHCGNAGTTGQRFGFYATLIGADFDMVFVIAGKIDINTLGLEALQIADATAFFVHIYLVDVAGEMYIMWRTGIKYSGILFIFNMLYICHLKLHLSIFNDYRLVWPVYGHKV